MAAWSMCGLPASPHDPVHESDARRIYCVCLADAANQCVAAHDPHCWKFTACMFARNGSPFSASGLEVDDTFATTVKECAGTLANYSVEDLKTCYGGFRGLQLHSTVRAGKY